MRRSAKSLGVQKANDEVTAIMRERGLSGRAGRNEAHAIRKERQNGKVHGDDPVKQLREIYSGRQGMDIPKMAVDQIARATEARINYLSTTISGIRQQLEAYQEELGQLVGVAKVLGIDADIPAGNLVETE